MLPSVGAVNSHRSMFRRHLIVLCIIDLIIQTLTLTLKYISTVHIVLYKSCEQALDRTNVAQPRWEVPQTLLLPGRRPLVNGANTSARWSQKPKCVTEVFRRSSRHWGRARIK